MNLDLINKLAENSILALLLAVSLIALYFVFNKYVEEVRRNDDLQEKRLGDYRETKDTVLKVLEEVKTTTTATLQSLLGRSK